MNNLYVKFNLQLKPLTNEQLRVTILSAAQTFSLNPKYLIQFSFEWQKFWWLSNKNQTTPHVRKNSNIATCVKNEDCDELLKFEATDMEGKKDN